jgi:hypothetical protein
MLAAVSVKISSSFRQYTGAVTTGTRILKPSEEEALDRGLVQADAQLAAELAGHLNDFGAIAHV